MTSLEVVVELLHEGFHCAIGILLIDDNRRTTLRRALSDEADTHLCCLKRAEDACINPRAPKHIAPFEVDERLTRERSQRTHNLVPWMGRDECPIRLLAIAEGIEYAQWDTQLLQRLNRLDMEDLCAELR